MIVTHKIKTDLIRRSVIPQINAVQGDTNTRVIELSLYSDGEEWTVPDGVAVSLRYRKPDGTKGVYDTLPDGSRAWSAEGNTVTMTLAPQMLTVEGAVFAQMEMVLNTDVLATFSLQVIVAENPAAGVLESEDYVNWLQWIEDSVDEHMLQAKESGEFNGPQGVPGPQGIQGPEGKSAYEFAVEGGFTGTEAEFSGKLAAQFLPTDGSVPMTGPIAMGGNKVTGMGTPVNSGDAATKSYVDGKRLTATATLSVNWTGSAAPYTQTLSVAGILSTDHPHVGPVYDADLAARQAQREAWGMVGDIDSGAGTITFTCDEEKPTVAIPIQIEVNR